MSDSALLRTGRAPEGPRRSLSPLGEHTRSTVPAGRLTSPPSVALQHLVVAPRHRAVLKPRGEQRPALCALALRRTHGSAHKVDVPHDGRPCVRIARGGRWRAAHPAVGPDIDVQTSVDEGVGLASGIRGIRRIAARESTGARVVGRLALALPVRHLVGLSGESASGRMKVKKRNARSRCWSDTRGCGHTHQSCGALRQCELKHRQSRARIRTDGQVVVGEHHVQRVDVVRLKRRLVCRHGADVIRVHCIRHLREGDEPEPSDSRSARKRTQSSSARRGMSRPSPTRLVTP